MLWRASRTPRRVSSDGGGSMSMLDLEAVRERRERFNTLPSYARAAMCADDVMPLVAEVERLRLALQEAQSR